MIRKKKRKKNGGEKAKSKSQDRCVTFKAKLHKTPYRARFTAGSSSCTTTRLSKLITESLKLIRSHCTAYCKTIRERTGVNRLDFHRLPGPVFDPPRREMAGRVTRWPCLWRNWKIYNLRVSDITGSETGLQFSYLFGSKLHQAFPYPPKWLSK